jgi:transcriptional regulator with XRE-family HTH domain
MTHEANGNDRKGAGTRASFLPFNPVDLVAMRVSPAQFARMVGVSKQAVSQWIKRGTVTLGPDGKLDPAKASREVIENTDPSKLRARVFKQATASHDELRQRIGTLEAELAEERDYGERREKAADFRAEDAADRNLCRLTDALEARFDEAIAARAAGTLHEWIQELVCVAFYEQDLEEFRRQYAEDNVAASVSHV